jgi:hypothetical protein
MLLATVERINPAAQQLVGGAPNQPKQEVLTRPELEVGQIWIAEPNRAGASELGLKICPLTA